MPDSVDDQNRYPRLTKLFGMISADNGGCTVDEVEELLAGLADEQLEVIAAGEDTEQALLRESLERSHQPGVVRACWDLCAVAFDG